jgi:transposase-like protein
MKYMMSEKELARLTVIRGATGGAYTVKQAARRLGVSTRWVKSLKKAVREQGDGAGITSPKTRRSEGERQTMLERRAKVRGTRSNRRQAAAGSGLAFNTPRAGFRMTRPGTLRGCTCAGTNAFRGISRRFGLFYRAIAHRKPCMPQVTKRLIHDSFFASVKTPELAAG